MELRHLESFCAVAEEMHVTRAAERLHIAQPALTQQIRLLEKELGFPLVRKTGRGIALTEAGMYFHKEAALILQQLHQACRQTRKIARGDSGSLSIGITEASAFFPALATVFSRCRTQWPAVQLTFTQNQAHELGAALRAGEIDAAFTCPIPATQLHLSSHNLSQDRMFLAVPAFHRFAERRTLLLSELKDEALIVVSQDQSIGSFERMLHTACEYDGFSPHIVQKSPELMMALSLVAVGVGLTFVPEYMSSIRRDALSYVYVQSPPLPLAVSLNFVTREREDSLLIENLKSLAISTFAEAHSK